ncbi:MAG: hypothetical protein IJA02_10735 [Clostridia bacterium]|nr:hypothetical protein [Clostridia bacterium]
MSIIKTYNPIISESPYTTGFFVKLPVPSNGEAILLSGENGILEINSQNRNSIPIGQIRNGKYSKQIRVDISAHNIEFSFEAFSANMVNKFKFAVIASCLVNNPIEIYKLKIGDMCSFVSSSIENTIKDMALLYNPDELASLLSDLESKQTALTSELIGAKVSNIKVSIENDELYRGHLKKKISIDNEAELKRLELEAAADLSNTTISDTTAILTDVVSGKKSISEAYGELKQIRSNDFEEKIKQFNNLSNLFKKLVDDGMLTEEQATAALKNQLPAISASSLENSKKANSERLQGITNDNNPYQAIDE